MKTLLKVKIGCAALKALKKELTVREIVKILPALTKMKQNGEPFGHLSAPQSEKDKESRALIADAILLYRALCAFKLQPDAERITRNVIIESAVAQLKYLVPIIGKKELAALTEEKKRLKFCGIVAKFPNADYRIVKAEGKEYHFDITRCRLVELIVAAGHPELKDAFCAGDGLFFTAYQPEILFGRESTIGEGKDTCEFRFNIK